MVVPHAAVHVYPTGHQVALALIRELCDFMLKHSRLNQQMNIALPGGLTPAPFFSHLPAAILKHGDRINLALVHFFWADERCVPPGHPDSNYGLAWRLMLRELAIPRQNIHRIQGENDPAAEAVRYAGEIGRHLRLSRGMPSFDWMVMGLGEDGHTASLFPGREHASHTGALCEVVSHPVTRQPRITVSLQVINQADRITFLVTGPAKSSIVREIINREAAASSYPAGLVKPVHGRVEWYLDKEAAREI